MPGNHSWFDTDYDPPLRTLTDPADVRSGQDSSLRVVDGLVRGRMVIGRCFADTYIALKVAATGRPLRLRLTLFADAETTKMWQARSRSPKSDTAGELPRALAILVQGRPRAAALMPIQATGKLHITMDVAADDVPADGLLTVGVTDLATHLPGWPTDPFAPLGVIGVRVDRIAIEDASVPVPVAPPAPVPAAKTAVPEQRLTKPTPQTVTWAEINQPDAAARWIRLAALARQQHPVAARGTTTVRTVGRNRLRTRLRPRTRLVVAAKAWNRWLTKLRKP
jgi:hypothetical protein